MAANPGTIWIVDDSRTQRSLMALVNRPLLERIKSYLMPQHNKIEEAQPLQNTELEVNTPAFVKRETEILTSLNTLRESGTQMDASLYVSGMSTAQKEHFGRLLAANNFTFQMFAHWKAGMVGVFA